MDDNTIKASDLFARCLEEEGVEYIFGIPGEENLDLLNSLKNSKIKLILTRHEQAAGFMAATVGRLSGKPGVCLSTLGPGATNLVTAAAYAQLGAMPMLMITGQKPIKSGKQGAFQIIDVVDMMKPLTKSAHQIVGAANIASRLREAFRIATEERPGAVHLELPEDIAAETCDNFILKESSARRPIIENKALEQACLTIAKAKQPILLIGAGANRKRTGKMLRGFIDKFKIPFISTQMGKGVVREDHPLFIGNAALSDNDFVHLATEKADCIINVGHDIVEKPPFFMTKNAAKVIHINFNSAKVDSVYFPQIELIGDIANAIWQISEKLSPQNNWDFSCFAKIKTEFDKFQQKYHASEQFPLKPQLVTEITRKIMPADGILGLDNGMYKIWFARNYPAYEANTVLLDNALATMGAGLPSAIAAKILNPKRKVLAVCGDGGFMMNSQEIETAVRLALDLVVLVLNDSAYGMIKWKQTGMNFPDFGLDFKNPNFVKYAQSYGAKGHKVTSVKNFENTLASALASKGVHLIDCPVDYQDNHQILNIDLPKQIQQLRKSL